MKEGKEETWPVEAEVADAELKRMTVSAGVLGIVFLAVAAWVGYTIYVTPRFPWEGLPLVPLAVFAAGGVADLALAATTRGAVAQMWRQGNFVGSRKRLGGASLALGYILGGIIPGIFLGRARNGLAPLADLSRPTTALEPKPSDAPGTGAAPRLRPVSSPPSTNIPRPVAPVAPRTTSDAGSKVNSVDPSTFCPKCSAPRPSPESKFCNVCGAPFP